METSAVPLREYVTTLLKGNAPDEFRLKWIEDIGAPAEQIDESYKYLSGIVGLSNPKIALHGTLLAKERLQLEQNFDFLRYEMGLSREKIAQQVDLLGSVPDRIRRNGGFLRYEMGLSREKIATYAGLLRSTPDRIRRNGEFLRYEMGLSKEKIAQQAGLLGRNSETMRRNGEFLRYEMGLSREKIAMCATLLGSAPDRIRRNYADLRRHLNKEEIRKFAGLLGISRETIDANIMFLSAHGMSRTSSIKMLLGTTPQKKREKIAFLLREVYDYRNLDSAGKVKAINNVRQLVSKHTRLLVESLRTLEGEKADIRTKISL